MVFCGGSVTKSFTAATVLYLVEKGVLTLEDSLYQWLPTYPHIDSTITIRQLLNHTSGVADYNDHPTIWSTIASNVSKYWTPEEIITSFVVSPYCLPGNEFYYSNTDYILLETYRHLVMLGIGYVSVMVYLREYCNYVE